MGNAEVGEEFSNLDELFDQNILKPDMKLYRVLVCVNQEKGHIQGVEFVLRTIASEFVSYSEMKLLGNLDSPNCKPYLIPDDDLVEYMEITYSEYVDSIVMRISNDYYSFWGNKRRDVDYKTKRWDFEEKWQPIGLSGTMDEEGIRSISPLTYSMQCAERSLNIQIVPNGQEYNDASGNQYIDGIDVKKDKDEDEGSGLSFLDQLNEDAGYPVYQWIIFIVAFLIFALILGVLCRCCMKKKRN